jgi:hypothetical protein
MKILISLAVCGLLAPIAADKYLGTFGKMRPVVINATTVQLVPSTTTTTWPGWSTVGTSATNGAASTLYTHNSIPTIQAGDILMVAIKTASGSVNITNSQPTFVNHGYAGTLRCRVLSRVATASDATNSFKFYSDLSRAYASTMVAYRGGTSVGSVSSNSITTTTNVITTAGITPAADSLLVMVPAINVSNEYTTVLVTTNSPTFTRNVRAAYTTTLDVEFWSGYRTQSTGTGLGRATNISTSAKQLWLFGLNK